MHKSLATVITISITRKSQEFKAYKKLYRQFEEKQWNNTKPVRKMKKTTD
jgi:hypothetical protein